MGVWISSQLSLRTHFGMLVCVMRIVGISVTLNLRLVNRGYRLSFKQTVAPEPIPWDGDVRLSQKHVISALEIITKRVLPVR